MDCKRMLCRCRSNAKGKGVYHCDCAGFCHAKAKNKYNDLFYTNEAIKDKGEPKCTP